MANTKSIDEVRDEIAERGASLSEKAAARLFAKPFEKDLSDLDASGLAAIFAVAHSEVASISKGKISWISVFNSYVALVDLVKAIRKPHNDKAEIELTELGYKVYGASNRIGMMYSVLRSEKNLSENDVRSVLEGAHPIALSGLGVEARKAIFSHAGERGSADGVLAIANEYDAVLDLVTAVKPLTRPDQPNHSGEDEEANE